MAQCVYCTTDFHTVCPTAADNGWCCCVDGTSLELSPVSNKAELIAALSDEKVFKDDLSTGRKRAAKAAPIIDGLGCEWVGLKAGGGGVIPIVGCRPEEEMLAVARHHGPDKSTFNNEVGVNLHRICVRCHNRWHTRNDEYYGIRPPQGEAYVPKEPYPCIPHDPDTRATESDYVEAETYWSTHRVFTAKPEPHEGSLSESGV